MSIEGCQRISLPVREDERGSLSFVEGEMQIPFPLQRVFYIYKVKEGTTRGEHAHVETEQFIVPVHGALTIIVDDGQEERLFRVDSPSSGIYVPSGIWTTLREFAAETVVLVLASTRYEEEDYIRDYEDYLEWREKNEC